MNRKVTILAPPLAFALAAVLAWLTTVPAERDTLSGNLSVPRPLQPDAVEASSMDLTIALNQLEREILHSPVTPVEIHDAQGMEAVLDSDYGSIRFPGGGMCAIAYAVDWAEEAPEEMFAWLVQGGTSFHRSLLPANILFKSWAEKDLEAALAAASRIPNRHLRRQALLSSLEVLWQSDPGRARELMVQNLSLFAPDGPSPILKTGKSTCEMLMSLPSGAERTHLLANLLPSMADWKGELSEQAKTVWEQAPATLQRDLVAAGFHLEGEVADSFEGFGDLLKERAESSGDRGLSEKFIEAQGAGWAKRDLAGALDWVQTYLKGRSRVERSARLFEHAASADFDNALRIWQTLPDSFLKVRAAGALSKGAPPDRESEAQAVLRSLSERERVFAR